MLEVNEIGSGFGQKSRKSALNALVAKGMPILLRRVFTGARWRQRDLPARNAIRINRVGYLCHRGRWVENRHPVAQLDQGAGEGERINFGSPQAFRGVLVNSKGDVHGLGPRPGVELWVIGKAVVEQCEIRASGQLGQQTICLPLGQQRAEQ